MRKLNAETQTGNSNNVIFATVLAVISLFHLLTIGPPAQRWGDPAQYIHHAKNIAEGLPYTQTDHIISPYDLMLAPEGYPIGLPVLLAPVYRLFGLNLIAFKLEIWLFLSILFVLLFFRFRDELPDVLLFISLVLFTLNPWLIEFKQAILSDIPFSAFVYGVSLFIASRQYKDNFWAAILIAVLFFCAYLMRAVGIVLAPAFLIYDLWSRKSLSLRTLVIPLVTGALIILSSLILPVNSAFDDMIHSWTPKIVVRNLIHYNHILRSFWPDTPQFPQIREVLYLSLNTFTFFGLVWKYFRGFSFLDFFGFLYCAVILCWPSKMGIRALLPVLPLYLLYILLGGKYFLQKIIRKTSAKFALSLSLGAIAFFSYIVGLSAVLEDVNTIPDGPQVDEAVQLFAYIRENTSKDSVFAFRKPRSLALFAERKATDHPAHLRGSVVISYFDEINVDYVIVDRESDKDQMQIRPFINEQQYQEVFGNERFLMYQVDSKDGDNK